MGLLRKNRQAEHERALDRMFQTRSHAWEQVGLARQLSMQAARRARREAVVILPLLAGVLIVYSQRHALFGHDVDTYVRVGTVIVLLALGWGFARALGGAFGPWMFRRMDPATAGTVGFLIRLVTIILTLLVALRIAGLRPATIAVGGAFTAVIFGLAAQQTLGNVIAGTVLLSARPFRVGERIRLQAGGVAGNVEGVVSSLGLLYLTLASGEDRIMVPNSVALNAAVTPLREPDSVNLRARLPVGTRPSELQLALQDSLTVATRSAPDIELIEVDDDEVVVQIGATPQRSADGPQLADQIIGAVGRLTANGNGSRPSDERREPPASVDVAAEAGGASRTDGTGVDPEAVRSGDGHNDPTRASSQQSGPNG